MSASVGARPFLKWAGGKSRLLREIRLRYPAGLGKTITKYAEPFVGGGAVLFDVLNSHAPKQVYISDTNAELINAYTVLRDDHEALIGALRKREHEYLVLGQAERKRFYYENRKRFNEIKLGKALEVESAALLIFLNKTCYNGLYRVNQKGEFNVPMGSYKTPRICDAENLGRVSRALKHVCIVCADYRKSEEFIDSGTFAYFDPPYRPLNTSSSFTSYTKASFDDAAQAALAEYVHRLSARGAFLAVSNSDPKNTNPEDEFFDELYSPMKTERLLAPRMINSRGGRRGDITELFIRNY